MHDNVRGWVGHDPAAFGLYFHDVTIPHTVECTTPDKLDMLALILPAQLHWWLCEALNARIITGVRYYRHQADVAALAMEYKGKTPADATQVRASALNSLRATVGLPPDVVATITDEDFTHKLTETYNAYLANAT